MSSAECGPASVGCIPVDTQQVRNSEFFPECLAWPSFSFPPVETFHDDNERKERGGEGGKKKRKSGRDKRERRGGERRKRAGEPVK